MVGYGATDDVDREEEMGQLTEDEDVKKSRKKAKKSGLKPGQALSFTGLAPRQHEGADMLDWKQLMPRVVGGCCCMLSTVFLVGLYAYHVLESSPELSGNSAPSAAKSAATAAAQMKVKDSTLKPHVKTRALVHVHHKSHASKKDAEGSNPINFLAGMMKRRPSSVNSRRLLSQEVLAMEPLELTIGTKFS